MGGGVALHCPNSRRIAIAVRVTQLKSQNSRIVSLTTVVSCHADVCLGIEMWFQYINEKTVDCAFSGLSRVT